MDPVAPLVRVFLVDDHEVVRRGVAEVLEDDPGITVAGEAGSCAEALARVPAVRPDVVVVDMRLPDGDGAELCRGLRAAGAGAALPGADQLLRAGRARRRRPGRRRRASCSSRCAGRRWSRRCARWPPAARLFDDVAPAGPAQPGAGGRRAATGWRCSPTRSAPCCG